MVDVLIVGAGATGLTLAIELLRRGISVRTIDAADGPFAGSRGKGLQPRTLELFDLMGVADAVMAEAIPYPFIKLHVGPLSVTAGSLGTHRPPRQDRPFPNLVMLEQWRTEAILRGRITELGGAVDYGVGLEGLAQDGASVKAQLSDGRTTKAAYLAGCDGGRSTVRRLLGLALVGHDVDEQTSIVADLQVEGLDHRYWHAYPLRRGGNHSLAPLPHDRLSQLQAPAALTRDGIAEGVARLTDHAVGDVLWHSHYRHQARMIDKYRVVRVLMAGDAAHVHPPSGAQGLNTGVQDAVNLGWKLAAAVQTGDDAILETYEAERLPVAAEVLNLTKMLHQSLSKTRGDRTSQLGLNYRGGPLAKHYAGTKLAAGDRMPDRILPDGRRLYAAMRHGGATQILQHDGRHILVRPDGYVAQIGDAVRADYFGMPVVAIKDGENNR